MLLKAGQTDIDLSQVGEIGYVKSVMVMDLENGEEVARHLNADASKAVSAGDPSFLYDDKQVKIALSKPFDTDRQVKVFIQPPLIIL